MPMFAPTSRSITKADVSKMQRRISALQSRAKNALEKADTVVQTAVTTLETTAGAFGLAVLEGRYGPQDIMGVPITLGLGLGLHAFAFLSDSDMSDHLHAFGNGALATYAVKEGTEIGLSMAAKAGAGEAVEGTDRLSDRELNSMSP